MALNSEARDTALKAAREHLNELGRLYAYGFAVEKDANRAHQHLLEAAQRGHFFAAAQLSRELLKGKHGLQRIPGGLLLAIRTISSGADLLLKRPHDHGRVTFQRLLHEDM